MNRFESQPKPRAAGAIRSLSLLAGAMTLSVAALAAAAGAKPAATGPGPADAERDPHFPISIAEAKQRAEARFQALDTDHSGTISPEELAAARMPHWMPRHGGRHDHGHRPMGHGDAPPPPTAEQRDAWREKHQERMQALDDQVFKQLDANGDGEIGKAEFSTGKLRDARRQAMRAQLFARLDTDGNGDLSPDELPDVTRRLEAMDADHDGTVTREEARAYHRSRHQAPDDSQG